MNKITVKAPAKINWYLNVGAKRSDGYHDISTVMQTVELYDTLSFERADHNDVRLCVVNGGADIPTDERNIVCRAARALGVYGVDIKLEKNIPSQAGLGGGSSDAASALCALNDLFELGKTKAELARIAAGIGSDVPFFVYGGACLIGGMGEEVTPLQPVDSYKIGIIKHSAGLSTKDVFARFDSLPYRCDVGLDEFLRHFNNEDKNLHEYLFNSLEPAALSLCPDIVRARDEMLELGACRAMMSGSGTSVFGLFDEKTMALAAERKKDDGEFWKV
ncbi:MAG: 4-(cytidine 5'-diphospho)-2-C-methyl-D-erythritol kinase [Clostridia bacterium]|nr:4-(cytidine 5'-diphospho)-2-C-methyl-D-erythritol kinase [Clostridia bacterium]